MPKDLISNQLETVGVSALAGFFTHFKMAQQQVEHSLLMLELSPDDPALLLNIQRGVATLQQSLQDIGLDIIQPLTTSLNCLLQAIGHKQLNFESLISDLILLAIDDIKVMIEKFIDGENHYVLVNRLPKICGSINNIVSVDEMYRDAAIRDALLLLDPSIEIIESNVSMSDTLLNLFSKDKPNQDELIAYGVEESEDFVFFMALSEPLESRAKYWNGRAHRMLRLALKMNDYAGRPVEPNQLAAAIYMHDAGMALLPLEIINSQDKYTDEQRDQIHQHPVVGYELMRFMKNWSEAALIVLQHHEQVDGNGYPYGLNEDAICDGAKILAIADAVDARTHERVHATMLKRPLLRVAIEIGKNAGVQFSEKWVNVFKDVFQDMRKANT